MLTPNTLNDDQSKALEMINKARAEVSEQWGQRPPLVWDSDLETQAKGIAKKMAATIRENKQGRGESHGQTPWEPPATTGVLCYYSDGVQDEDKHQTFFVRGVDGILAGKDPKIRSGKNRLVSETPGFKQIVWPSTRSVGIAYCENKYSVGDYLVEETDPHIAMDSATVMVFFPPGNIPGCGYEVPQPLHYSDQNFGPIYLFKVAKDRNANGTLQIAQYGPEGFKNTITRPPALALMQCDELDKHNESCDVFAEADFIEVTSVEAHGPFLELILELKFFEEARLSRYKVKCYEPKLNFPETARTFWKCSNEKSNAPSLFKENRMIYYPLFRID